MSKENYNVVMAIVRVLKFPVIAIILMCVAEFFGIYVAAGADFDVIESMSFVFNPIMLRRMLFFLGGYVLGAGSGYSLGYHEAKKISNDDGSNTSNGSNNS